VSTRIDTLEPNGEPLAVLLASIVARISSPDFIEPHASSPGADSGDIARDAARAIAGVPLGIARAGAGVDVVARLRSFVAAGIGASTRFLRRAHRTIAAAVAALLRIGANAVHRLRHDGVPALRQRVAGLAAPSGRKVGAGLALGALGVALVITFVSGRHGRLEQPSNDDASSPTPVSTALAEERPLRDSPDEFTRANMR
jgi:hypothetical protein